MPARDHQPLTLLDIVVPGGRGGRESQVRPDPGGFALTRLLMPTPGTYTVIRRPAAQSANEMSHGELPGRP